MDEFRIHGKLVMDAEVSNQPLALPAPEGFQNAENFQSFAEAQINSTDSLKDNTAIMKEFGNIMPEIIKNLRAMNDIVSRTNQNLPAVHKTLTSDEQKQKLQDAYLRQNLLGFFNNGSNLVQSYANGNVSGMMLSGVNAISNTTSNLSKMAENADMTNLAKGLVAGGVVAAAVGAVVKGGDALASKFIEAMPTIYGTGRAFGSMDDTDSMIAYQRLNRYNRGTNFDIDTFQGIAQSLRKMGVGNGLSPDEQYSLVGSIAQTTGKWAYRTGGDASQYANLAGLMSRYGGSTNVASDFNYLINAGKASGLNDTQIPEFLSAIQKVMEDGIAKGFSRSATEVASTMLMFSKMSGNNAFWQGEQGAKIINQANAGLANATALSKTSDIIAYRAIARAYEGMGANGKSKAENALGDLYLSDGGYVNNMMLLEQGLNADNFSSIMGAIGETSTSTEGQIERIRQMFGVNYTGASRLLALDPSKFSSKDALQAEINKIQNDPDNQNKETRYQQAMNDIKEAVINIGDNMAELKIAGMELVSGNVQRIADFVAGDAKTKEDNKKFNQIYSSLSKEQQRELNEIMPTFVSPEDKLAYIQWYVNGKVGMPNGVNKTKIYSDYEGGKLKSSVRWGNGGLLSPRDLEEMPDYINQTYGKDINNMFDGNESLARAFMAALQNTKRFTDRVVEETKDTIVTSEEKKETVKLLQELVTQVKAGITLNDMQ